MQSLSLRSLLLLLLAAGLWTLPAQAQRTNGALGFGGQGGTPSGVTLKVHNNTSASYDVLAAWDARDSFFLLNAHAQFNEGLNAQNVDEGELEWFVGPGAFVGFFDDINGNDFDEGEAVIGASGRAGLNFAFAEHFEIYGQVTPRLALIPSTQLQVGGGIGIRFYP
jgi:hypothetical protein